MCGFVAIVGPDKSISLQNLINMRDKLSHRGPDGEDHYIKEYKEGSIMMGFRRLSILDTRSIANQPMQICQKIICFNGEIYNYLEIKKELLKMGRDFKTESDTEVLLQSYDQWGKGMMKKINGMFAFVIWDLNSKKLFLARDRLGEKPLFYTRIHNNFIFGSEIKAILAHPLVETKYRVKLMSQIAEQKDIIFGGQDTIFENIKQFEASTYMEIDLKGQIIDKQEYWAPNYNRKESSHDINKSNLRELLVNSVNKRVRSDVPLTSCLSGGLDSSILVSLLANEKINTGEPIDSSISVRFPDDPTIDEGLFISKFLEKNNIHNISISPTPNELLKDIRKMHWHHETIIPGISMFLEWSLMKTAKANNFKVIIDGQGSDELFAGYDFYFQALQVSKANPKKGLKSILESIKYGNEKNKLLNTIKGKYLNSQRRFNAKPGLGIKEIFKFYMTRKKEYKKYNLINENKNLDFFDLELLYQLKKSSLPSNLFSGDRNSMAHSIECRYPYLDYDLIDFSMKIPTIELIKNSWSKYILRKTFEKNLPNEITWRVDKVGFQAPEDSWISSNPLNQWIKERIFDDNLISVPTYKKNKISKAFNDHINGVSNNTNILWGWASLSELLDMKKCGYWE
tara:strand:- start:9619 stop:11496 length:1878 start_codon:yes stop_codon:yes gene_type:complete